MNANWFSNFEFFVLQRISATLQLTAFLSIAIISDIGTVNGRPTDSEGDASKALDKTYYLSRSWGDPMMPFSISYSEYARTQHEMQKQSTQQPLTATPSRGSNTPSLRRSRKSRNRTRSTSVASTSAPPTSTTIKYFSMPLIFTSNGWGPMGWLTL